ncbi:unnamed protein product [Caenorhabditis nigoni]
MLYRMLLSFFFTTTSYSVAKDIFGLIILTQKMRFLSIARKDRKVQPILCGKSTNRNLELKFQMTRKQCLEPTDKCR